jgi:hypothetical protein
VAAADQRHLTVKASIANISTKVENDQWETVRKLTKAQGVSTKMVHKDLKLSKMSARWISKLTDNEMKKERVRTCEVFVAIIAVVPYPSWTMFSLTVSQQRVKRELASLTVTQETSKKEWEWCVKKKSHGGRFCRSVPVVVRAMQEVCEDPW